MVFADGFLADGGFAHTVTDGPLILAAAVSALVGVVGFLSPCVLPLVPGYLSYVAGLSGETDATVATDAAGAPNATVATVEAGATTRAKAAVGTAGTSAVGGTSGGSVATAGGTGATRGTNAAVGTAAPRQRRMVAGAVLFVLGFTVVLSAQGAAFGALGGTIRNNQRTIDIVFGSITIVLGIVFLGGFRFLQREFKIHKLPRAGLAGAPLLGAAFGFAWAPCLTPTYGAVYSLSLSEGTAGRGTFLTVCYCLGLGIPFVLVALGFGWVTRLLGFLRRHTRIVSGVGGGLLIVIGILLVTGEWAHLVDSLRSQVGTGAGIDI